MCKKCSILHKMYARESDVQKVLYTAQNVCSRVGCAKSALYGTKCTLESGMCKKCSILHKMYAGESDVQKVHALYNTKCTLESGVCKKCSNSTKCMLESQMYKIAIFSSKCTLESMYNFELMCVCACSLTLENSFSSLNADGRPIIVVTGASRSSSSL